MRKRLLCIIMAICLLFSCMFAAIGCSSDNTPPNGSITDNTQGTGEEKDPPEEGEKDPPEEGEKDPPEEGEKNPPEEGEKDPPENNDVALPDDGCAYKLIEIYTTANKDVNRAGKFKCDDCGKEAVASIDSKHLGMPVINFEFGFNGDIDDVSKTNKVTVSVAYEGDNGEFDCYATLKVQGNSSAAYPKKNYTIQLYNEKDLAKKNKVKLVDSWGKQSKYCLKANYIDYSQARNVVSAKLYGQIAATRDLDDEYAGLVNGGAIDGYPVCIFVGEQYHGLYTLNIPKDKWLFGMSDDSDTQALLMGDAWTDSVRLMEHVADDFSNGWDLEYCSTEEKPAGTKWVADSFNRMMDFVKNNDGTSFKNGIRNYVNVERSIDAMIYTTMLNAGDNLAKNILWATYDGVHWTSVVYDLDATWGLSWDGKEISNDTAGMIYRYYGGADKPKNEGYMGNLLWSKLYYHFQKEVLQRYAEIRKSAMSDANVEKTFTEFFNKIPSLVYTAESKKWKEVPSQTTNNKQQILGYSKQLFKTMDIALGEILESL